MFFLLKPKPTTEAMITKYIIDPIPKSMKTVTWYKTGGYAGYYIRFRFTIDGDDFKKIIAIHNFRNADSRKDCFKIPADSEPNCKIYQSPLEKNPARSREIIYNEDKRLVYYYYTRY